MERITYSGSRLEEPLRDIFLALNAGVIAIAQSREWPINPVSQSVMLGRLIPRGIMFPCPQMFRGALFHNETETSEWFLIDDRQKPIETVADHEGGTLHAMQGFINGVTQSEFLLFYERFQPLVHTEAQCDVKRYEPTWAFARVIRNAIVHAGVVTINDQTFPPVTWQGLTYGPTQNGRRVMGLDLESPDLIFLMLEMDLALSRLGLHEPPAVMTRLIAK